MLVSWPHQLSLGERCVLEPDIYFKYDGYWKPGPSIRIGNRVFIGRGVEFNIQGEIEIGDDCLIASGCIFVDHDHGTGGSGLINRQPPLIRPISIAGNVWIGANVVVLKGVTIGEGSVVAAGTVVTKEIPAGEIWGGVPARKLGSRMLEAVEREPASGSREPAAGAAFTERSGSQ